MIDNQKINEKLLFLRDHLQKYIQKRLNNRLQQKLKQHFSNCYYSQIFNRFYICSNINFLKKDKYVICSQQRCNKCKLYKPKYTLQDKIKITQQFYKDIADPAICGNKQPKIAVLLWVLKLFQDCKIQEKQSLCKKIIQIIRNGFVWK